MDSLDFTFSLICRLARLNKSGLRTPEFPPTVRQSDSRSAAVQEKRHKMFTSKTSGHWNHCRDLFLFHFSFLCSNQPLPPFVLSHSFQSWVSLLFFRLLLPSRLWSCLFIFSSTTCHLSVWLHLTLLSHYRCDLSPFIASTLTDTLMEATLLHRWFEQGKKLSSSVELFFKSSANQAH